MNKSLNFRLDPWPSEYEGPIQLSEIEEHPEPNVDISIEGRDWEAVAPLPSGALSSIAFVDGVRRVESRLLADSDGSLVHGLFGSLAVGSVSVDLDRGGSAWVPCQVERLLIVGRGIKSGRRIVRAGNLNLEFRSLSIPENTPGDVLSRLQDEMRQCEATMAAEVARAIPLVVLDGPLNFFMARSVPVVGLIKRLHRSYLSIEHFRLVAALEPGQRTPIFSIPGGRETRWSWFVRLAWAHALHHPLAGVIRLEMAGSIPLVQVVDAADDTARQLPRFASTPIRDPRSPQNLLPVGALERELTRQLGDSLLIRRALELQILKEAAA